MASIMWFRRDLRLRDHPALRAAAGNGPVLGLFVIDPALCTECVGHYDEPQCVVVCPVECIDPDPAHPESQEALLAKLARLQAQEPSA